jgi:F-type H+-transporting ATPase subunit delta
MSGQKTFARPYAKAIFELALKDNTLAFWSDALKLLSFMANDVQLKEACKNPRFTLQQMSEIFSMVLKKENLFNAEVENLLLLLGRYKRLLLLPLIAILFEESRAQIEKTIKATVESAAPISPELRLQLQDRLKKRLGREVSLTYTVVPSLIGGAIISAGDWVVDYSVKNHLEKLKQTLLMST